MLLLIQSLSAAPTPLMHEDMLRHDKWLCMMWPRLTLLRELPSPDGTLAICIDDNEVHFLHSACGELTDSHPR